MNQSEKKAPGNLIPKMGRGGRQGHSPAQRPGWRTWPPRGCSSTPFPGGVSWPRPPLDCAVPEGRPSAERRYRLCPPGPRRRALPGDSGAVCPGGWQFLRYWGTSCVSYFLFYSDDPAAPEPYTDPNSLYEALRPPKKDVLNDLLLGGVLYTSAVILRATRILDRQLSFLPNWILAAAAALLIALWLISLLLNGIDWLTVLALRQEIRRRDTVRPAPPSALFAARCFFSSLLSLLQTGLLAVALALIFTLFRINSDLPWSSSTPTLTCSPCRRWRGTGAGRRSPTWRSRTSSSASMRRDRVPRTPAGASRCGTTSASGLRHQRGLQHGPELLCLRRRPGAWELLADLVQDLQSPDGDLLSYLPDQLPFQRETVPGAEEFLVRREGENWDVVALEGDRVLALRYSGALDLTDWYDEIAAMLTPEE